jgi:hypothetical protein
VHALQWHVHPREDDPCAAFSERDRSRLVYSAGRSRTLSELAPVMTTTLSLIPGINFGFPISPLQRLRR